MDVLAAGSLASVALSPNLIIILQCIPDRTIQDKFLSLLSLPTHFKRSIIGIT